MQGVVATETNSSMLTTGWVENNIVILHVLFAVEQDLQMSAT
jgi:hypothetical protein